MLGTGKFDKNGDEMMVGDIVHFRTNGLSGRGVVYLAEKPDRLSEDLFRIRDTTPGKREGRIYPFYPDAKYRIDGHEETDAEKLERWFQEHDSEDMCQYCHYDCDNTGVRGGPNGPVYPPCADWDDSDHAEHLDIEAILEDMKEEES